jgi:peptidyl-prolyl cis-trans isomerase D
MSVLEKIRSKTGLLVGFVGLALVIFILQAAFDAGGNLFGTSDTSVGKIKGEDVDYNELKVKVDEFVTNYSANGQQVDENTRGMIIDQAWAAIVNERVLKSELKKLGVDVCEEELADLMLVHPHSYVNSYFTDRQSGKVYEQFADAQGALDVKKLNAFVAKMTPEQEKFWIQLEEQIRDIRKNEKYYGLIKKGIFATSNEAKFDDMATKRLMNVKFVIKPYSLVADSTIKISDEELKDYYNKNQYKYIVEEQTRKIDYLVWEAEASKEDIDELKNNMVQLANDFRERKTASEDSAFIQNSNDNQQLDIAKFKKGTINPNIDTAIYSASVGTVFGPYAEGEQFKVSKLMNVSSSLDSAKVRHILLAYAGSGASQEVKRTKEQAKKLADSLLALLKKGAKFPDFVKTYSDDGGKKMPPGKTEKDDWTGKDGNYGWLNENSGFVEPFKRFGLDGKKADLGVVESNFGYHIMEILDVSKGRQNNYLLGTISSSIAPSSNTVQSFYAKASEFSGKNNTGELFDKAVDSEKLNKRVSGEIKENDRNIPGIENPKELIRWMFKAQLNDVSEAFTFGNRFVVAKITEIKEKGFAPLESVKDDVTNKAKQEKKAEQILNEVKTKAANSKSIDEYASKLGVSVSNADNFSFANSNVPNVGRDDLFAGAVSALKANTLSQPIKGSSGIYIAKIETENFTPAKDLKENKKSISNTISGRAEFEVFEALKKLAEIEDHKAQRDF